MKLKRLVILVGILLWLPVHVVTGLALSDVELQSNLNQRLSARIQLIDLPEGGVEDLQVSVSDSRDLEAAGRHLVLKHEVVVDGSDYYLVVSSRDAIREPILNFVVELSWSAGRLLRNYALIIDPR